MKKYLLGSLIVLILSFAGCSDNSTDPNDCVRIGAICNDGTRSSATGSGACSGHGGVREWICQ